MSRISYKAASIINKTHKEQYKLSKKEIILLVVYIVLTFVFVALPILKILNIIKNIILVLILMLAVFIAIVFLLNYIKNFQKSKRKGINVVEIILVAFLSEGIDDTKIIDDLLEQNNLEIKNNELEKDKLFKRINMWFYFTMAIPSGYLLKTWIDVNKNDLKDFDTVFQLIGLITIFSFLFIGILVILSPLIDILFTPNYIESKRVKDYLLDIKFLLQNRSKNI